MLISDVDALEVSGADSPKGTSIQQYAYFVSLTSFKTLQSITLVEIFLFLSVYGNTLNCVGDTFKDNLSNNISRK